MRERMLFIAETKNGKTKAFFDIIKKVLDDTERGVHFLSFDDGAERFITKTIRENPRFHYYDAVDWITARDQSRQILQNLEQDDIVFLDRIDMVWEHIQHYYAAAKWDVEEKDLDEMFMQKRLETLNEATALMRKGDDDSVRKAKAIKQAINNLEFANLDWKVIKGGVDEIVFSLTSGYTARTKRVSVYASTLATPIDQMNPQALQKPDSRNHTDVGLHIEGEKHIPAYFDTLVFFKRVNGKYLAWTRDRERENMNAREINNFPDDYFDVTGVNIIE